MNGSSRRGNLVFELTPQVRLGRKGWVTLVRSNSNWGLTSSTAFIPRFSSSNNGANFESNSMRVLTQASLISPSEIRWIIVGERTMSSTIGPR
jgi:hypothetical protein